MALRPPRPLREANLVVLEGKLGSATARTTLLNGTWTDLFPGDCVYSPRGSIHGFKNHTDRPIRVFINIAPAGFEHFFAEAAEVWAEPGPDMSRMKAIENKYGIHGVDATYGTNKTQTTRR